MGCSSTKQTTHETETIAEELTKARVELKQLQAKESKLGIEVKKLEGKRSAPAKQTGPHAPSLEEQLKAKKTDFEKAEDNRRVKEYDVKLLQAKHQSRKADDDAAYKEQLWDALSKKTPPAQVARVLELEHEVSVAQAWKSLCEAEVSHAAHRKALYIAQKEAEKAETELNKLKASAGQDAKDRQAIEAAVLRHNEKLNEQQLEDNEIKVAEAKIKEREAEHAVQKAKKALRIAEAKIPEGKPQPPTIKSLKEEYERNQGKLEASKKVTTQAEQKLRQLREDQDGGALITATKNQDGDGEVPARKPSSSKIEALNRGVEAHDKAEIKRFHTSKLGGELNILNPAALGFLVSQAEHQLPQVSDQRRFDVRDLTTSRVLLQLGQGTKTSAYKMPQYEDGVRDVLRQWDQLPRTLPNAVLKQLQMVHLFTLTKSSLPPKLGSKGSGKGGRERRSSSSGAKLAKHRYLLGKFDCLAVPAVADYDESFNRIWSSSGTKHEFNASNVPGNSQDSDIAENWQEPGDGMGWFWVIHAAAPNIGETADAEDFDEYATEEGNPDITGTSASNPSVVPSTCSGKRLKESEYLTDMCELWQQVFRSIVVLGCTDVIVFPFGMGAFLRNLKKNDVTYDDNDKMWELRRAIAEKAFDAMAIVLLDSANALKTSIKRVHFCLVNSSVESSYNHNAFVEAADAKRKSCPGIQQCTIFRQNADALQVAHDLSTQSKTNMSVAVLNGANRKLIGNHWFTHGARTAIDENFHRRSSTMGRAALLFNKGTWPLTRDVSTLASHVSMFGGRVVPLDDKSPAPSGPPLDAKTASGNKNKEAKQALNHPTSKV